MRALTLIGLSLLLGSCSCSRDPDAKDAPASAITGPAAPTTSPQALAAQAADQQAVNAQAVAMSQAVSTVHAYLALVAGKDWEKADAYWTGGKPSPRPDDYSVRGIEDLRSLRINNESPKPLDNQSPTQSVEVPVILRIRKQGSPYEIKGWYRLRQKVGADGWEITSASLQPTLG